MNNRKEYSAYGTWCVTTEGDCEGRSTVQLGTYTGYIDELALALADKAYYELHFQMVNPEALDMTPKKTKVMVQLGIDSGTWDLKGEDRAKYVRKMLKDRNLVKVVASPSYAGFELVAVNRDEVIRKQALNKLNDEDKRVLGL